MGAYDIEMIEVFHRKFLKKLLHVRDSTPNCIIYGELGIYPLQMNIDKRLIGYWFRILNKEESTYVHIIYNIVFRLYTLNEYKCKWLCKIKNILDDCGLSYMWDHQDTIDTKQCKLIINQRIEDLALHRWYANVSSSSLCSLYRIFKKSFCFEQYLLNGNFRDRTALTRFRCTNAKLPVYNQIYQYDCDICTLCDMNVRGDEYHYIFICSFFNDKRNLYLDPYFCRYPSDVKFEQLFTQTNKKKISRLAKFTKAIIEQF